MNGNCSHLIRALVLLQAACLFWRTSCKVVIGCDVEHIPWASVFLRSWVMRCGWFQLSAGCFEVLQGRGLNITSQRIALCTVSRINSWTFTYVLHKISTVGHTRSNNYVWGEKAISIYSPHKRAVIYYCIVMIATRGGTTSARHRKCFMHYIPYYFRGHSSLFSRYDYRSLWKIWPHEKPQPMV